MPGRKSGGFREAAGGMGNLKGVIAGSLSIIVACLMIGLAMTTISDMLDDGSITWSDYPGAESLWGMVPMMMGIGLILFGVLLGWLGYRGQSINIKTAIASPLVAIIMVLFAPIVIGGVEDIVNHTDAADYTGLDIFSFVPMLYAVAVVMLPGILGYLGVRTKD